MSYTTEARLSSSAGNLEIRHYHWTRPLDEVICDDAPIFGLSLSPVPKGSMGCLESSRARRDFRPVGRMLFRPAGMPLQFVNAGGRQRLMMCSLEPGEGSAPAHMLSPRLDVARPALDVRNPALIATMRKLAAEVAAPGFASAAITEALILTLVIEFLRISDPSDAPGSPHQGGLAPWQLKRIDEALYSFDGAAPSVTDLAALVGVSPRHLLRTFRASVGTSVLSHITRIRLERACAMLATTRLPVKQVAARCGFATIGGFSAAFQREIGLAPKYYRAREQNSCPFPGNMSDSM